MPTPYEAWVVGKALSGQLVTADELAAMSEPWRTLAEKLIALPLTEHALILEIFLAGRLERDGIINAIASQDAMGPAPALATASVVRSAHLGDLTSCQTAGRFIWPNWIVRAHFTLLSSDPKIGKTHLALDLARRLWFGLPWPDGQPATFPAGPRPSGFAGIGIKTSLESAPRRLVCPPKPFGSTRFPMNPMAGGISTTRTT